MVKNCDNCGNQNPKKLAQGCGTFGYPLFADCTNWIPANEQIKQELAKEELARKLCW